MDVRDLLIEGYDRLPGLVRSAVADLPADRLRWSPGPGSNSIGWLVWHLTRVQDSSLAELLGREQVWVSGDWAAGCGLDPDPGDTGYGHTSEQVAAVAPRDARVLIGYHETVAARTRDFLRGLKPADLDEVVDENWDPPVTMGIRLVSVLEDDLQHAGQAAYVRGLAERA